MKFYTLSPEGVPENQVLFPLLRPEFEKQGHSFTRKPYQADIILIDLHTRIADYNQDDVDYIIDSCKPICTWDEFDKGGMSSLKWPYPITDQQSKIFMHIAQNNIKAVHFCRLLDKTQKLPENLFPYEKSVSYQEPPVSKEELFNREWDIVFIANHAPSRQLISDAINNDGRLKCLTMIGAEKISFEKFVEIHKTGKLFISSAAGGFTDERVQCLFSISGIIRQRTDQLVKDDFTHLENCLRIDSPPTKKDLDDIYEIVNNKDRLYEIYMNGYNFVKEHYSEQYFAQYYLDTMKKEGII